MRKAKLLAVSLVIALAVGSVSVPTYAYRIEEDEEKVVDIIKGVKPEGISILDECVVTDLEMLDDIVERSYNNDFSEKYYIIRNTTKETGRIKDNYDLWGHYLEARGDVLISPGFNEEATVYDETTGYYYHSIRSYCSHIAPQDENGGMARWSEYIDAVKQAEISMGYVEGNNLCDYELIQQAYIWLCNINNISNGGSNGTKGQTAIEGILDKKAMCAGYSRIFNRFMYDFGIDSYWISMPSINHAWNIVKLKNNYYEIDCQASNYHDCNEYNKHKVLLYDFPIIGIPNWNNLESFSPEFNSIIYYNLDFVNRENTREFSNFKEPLMHKYHYNKETGEFLGRHPSFSRVATYESVEGEDVHCEYCEGDLSKVTTEFYKPEDNACVECGKVHRYPYNETLAVNESVDKAHKDKVVKNSCYFEGTEDYYDWWTATDVKGEFIIYINGESNYKEIWEKEEPTTTEPITTEPVTTPTEEESTPEDVTTPDNKEEFTTPEEISTTDNNEEVTTSEVVSTTNNTVETTATEKVTTKEEETTTAKKVSNKKPNTNKKKVKTPKKPTKVKLINIKKRKIMVSWKKVKNVKKYEVQWSTSKKFKAKKTNSKKVVDTIYSIKKLKGIKLKNRTKYYVRVRAINGSKKSDWSKTVKVTIRR